MGSFHSVSIMVDVSDDVFYDVVKPAKSEKKFKKLITNLLIAYANNSEVRKIVDGSIENDDLIGIKSLKEKVEKVSQTAYNIGEINKSNISSIDGALEDINHEVNASRGIDGELKHLLDCNLKMQQDFMSTVTNMLQLVLTNNTPSNVTVPNTIETPVPQTNEVLQEPQVPITPVFNFDDDDDDDGGFEETDSPANSVEESLTDPNDFINNLLGDGNSFMG